MKKTVQTLISSATAIFFVSSCISAFCIVPGILPQEPEDLLLCYNEPDWEEY